MIICPCGKIIASVLAVVFEIPEATDQKGLFEGEPPINIVIVFAGALRAGKLVRPEPSPMKLEAVTDPVAETFPATLWSPE